MRKYYRVGVLAIAFCTLWACTVERTPSGPSALSPAGSAIPLGSADGPGTSWACLTHVVAEPSVTTGEWMIQPQDCFSGSPAISNRGTASTPVGSGEPAFAPGPANFRSTVNGSTVLLQWDQGAGPSAWQIEAG